MLLQKTLFEPNSNTEYVIPENLWYDVFSIFIKFIFPLLIFCVIVFGIIKFYGMFKKINETLRDINKKILSKKT